MPQIGTYYLTYWSRTRSHEGNPYLATIVLYESAGTGYLGTALFHRRRETIPETTADGSYHFMADELPVVLDLLRNEGPFIAPARGDIPSLRTMAEPVGEGEL